MKNSTSLLSLEQLTARSEGLGPSGPFFGFRERIAAVPRAASTDLDWWRGVREGRIAAMVEQSVDDAMAGVRSLPVRATQRRAGFKAGVLAQAEIEEAELDRESSLANGVTDHD
jgi:hypothetical protein